MKMGMCMCVAWLNMTCPTSAQTWKSLAMPLHNGVEMKNRCQFFFRIRCQRLYSHRTFINLESNLWVPEKETPTVWPRNLAWLMLQMLIVFLSSLPLCIERGSGHFRGVIKQWCHNIVSRGIWRGVSRGFRKPLWILHSTWNIKKLKLQGSRIWNLSWDRTHFKLLS